MNVKIYYGLSGTFKGTTINSKNEGPVLETGIKSWKYYQEGAFKGKTEYNDLNYGILQLVRLGDFIKENISSNNTLNIERGVTDTLFYYYGKTQRKEDPTFIKSVCEEESKLLNSFTIERILLVQKDYNFLKDIVFLEKSRRDAFNNDPDLYFKLQEKYVNFTTKYNKINQVVEITNAKDYITNDLGLKWLIKKK